MWGHVGGRTRFSCCYGIRLGNWRCLEVPWSYRGENGVSWGLWLRGGSLEFRLRTGVRLLVR